ncbi:hypothetical protein MIB92_14845 [Aestuariirhabdus sp. Z084]|uniref:hypothetical protein n=1 Tax=Aestuariirhabdus haliotis TaxID=2918751 RepID=UPI00201B44FE|nr:hypothetical protein [Aestuariirhabdus haliotis]MCL6416937.1 hypothetical protein [Aestuariirhabdus haliotis]MCL6420960.1 hypothetical protein [Aestuariirhabdus haliotis]
MLFDDMIKPISNHSKRTLIVVLSIVIAVLILLAYLNGGVYTVWAWIAGFPLALVFISLVFGKASKGKGAMSTFTLNLVGGCVGLGSIVAIFYGNHTAWVGIVVSILILRLGKQRSAKYKA